MIEIYGLIFCTIIGTIGHFLYNFTNKNKVLGFLFSKNESTWEHLKLGITPITIWSILELFIIKNSNIIVLNSLKILIFSFLVIFLFYTSKFILKKNILVLDISIFYIALAIAFLVSLKNFNNPFSPILYILSILLTLFIIYAYKNFSKNPPNNFLFRKQF